MLKMDSTGSYEWKPEDREQINKYIGEQQLFKQVERLMKTKGIRKRLTLYVRSEDLALEELTIESNLELNYYLYTKS